MAKKKRRAKKKSGLKFFLILLIFLIVSVGSWGLFLDWRIPFVEETAIGECIGGLGVLAVSPVYVDRSDNLFGKDVIQVLATVRGQGDCLTIKFDADDISKGLRGEGYEVQYDRFIDVIPQYYKKVYEFYKPDPRKVGYMKVETMSGWKYNPLVPNALKNCNNDCINKVKELNPENVAFRVTFENLGQTCYCYYEDKGNPFYFGDFKTKSVDDWEVLFVSEGVSSKFDYEDAVAGKDSATLGNRVFIRWEGNLLKDKTIHLPDFDAKQDQFGAWTIIDKDARSFYISEKGFFESDFDNCITISCRDKKVEEFNKRVEDSLEPQDDAFKRSFDVEDVEKISITKSGVDVELKEFPIVPVYTLEIDADWVGIRRLVMQPEVTCPRTCEYESGDRDSVDLKVKNVGSSTGSVWVSLVCDGEKQYLVENELNSIEVGDTKTAVGKPSSYAIEEDKEQECVFTARDKNSVNKDSCSFTCDVKKRKTCSVGATSCSSDGKDLITILDKDCDFKETPCVYGCVRTSTGADCRKEVNEICDNEKDDDNDGKIDCDDDDCIDATACKPEECRPWLAFAGKTVIPNLNIFCYITYSTGIKTLLVGLGGAVIFLFLWLIFRDMGKKYKRDKNLYILIAVIISLLVTVFLYFFWWILLIVLGLLVLIKIIIKMFFKK